MPLKVLKGSTNPGNGIRHIQKRIAGDRVPFFFPASKNFRNGIFSAGQCCYLFPVAWGHHKKDRTPIPGHRAQYLLVIPVTNRLVEWCEVGMIGFSANGDAEVLARTVGVASDRQAEHLHYLFFMSQKCVVVPLHDRSLAAEGLILKEHLTSDVLRKLLSATGISEHL